MCNNFIVWTIIRQNFKEFYSNPIVLSPHPLPTPSAPSPPSPSYAALPHTLVATQLHPTITQSTETSLSPQAAASNAYSVCAHCSARDIQDT